jgi:hypothetical protein
MRKRPAFTPVGEEMRRRSALLAAEVLRWPGTRVGKMFGMQSLYRGDVVFGMLPVTKGLWEANAIMVKIYGADDAKKMKRREGEKWQSVPVLSDGDLTAALERLDEAYRSVKLLKK